MIHTPLCLRVLVLALVMVASPLPASAQFIEFIEWLDRLSGPGFHGTLAAIPLACKPQRGPIHFGDCTPLDRVGRALDDNDRRLVIALRVGRHASGVDGTGWDRGENNLIYPAGTADDDKRIDQFTLGGSLLWQVHRVFDVYAAFDRSYFVGPRVQSFGINTVSPGVSLKPLAGLDVSRWLRPIRVNARLKSYLGTMTAEQFGAVPGSFTSKNETIWGWGIAYDWIFSPTP